MENSKCPYSDDELKELHFKFFADDLYITHPNHAPHVMKVKDVLTLTEIGAERMQYVHLTKEVISRYAKKLEFGGK